MMIGQLVPSTEEFYGMPIHDIPAELLARLKKGIFYTPPAQRPAMVRQAVTRWMNQAHLPKTGTWRAAHPEMFSTAGGWHPAGGGPSISTRPPYPPHRSLLGLSALGYELYGSLGNNDDDVATWHTLVNDLTNWEYEIRQAADSAPADSALAKNGPAYAQALMRAREQLVFPQMEGYIRAGGSTGKNMMKMIASFRELLTNRKALYLADQADSTGGQSAAIAQADYTEAVTDEAKSAERVEFWNKVTDVNNPFSLVGALSNIKALAIGALVVGGIILLLPSIFRTIGSYQKARAGA
jgi:hypothetical protein